MVLIFGGGKLEPERSSTRAARELWAPVERERERSGIVPETTAQQRPGADSYPHLAYQ